MSDVHVVVLAAGKGTRMKSALPKVLHRVLGAPMIDHVLTAAASLRPLSTAVVVGHQADVLRAALEGRPELIFVVQEPQRGTAHALMTTEEAFRTATGTLVLLYGDVPMLSGDTLKQLVHHHESTAAAATLITAIVDNPHGYGRILRSGGRIARIVEERDASAADREIREVNAGIYAFALDGLFDALRAIPAENAQGEYYLPDLVAVYRQKGLGVETLTVTNPDEIRGINSHGELAEAGRLLRHRKNAEVMAAGVALDDPATTYIARGVQIGPDTVIHPGVSLEGATVIGSACEIHSGVRIVDSQIGDRVTVHNHSVIAQSTVDSGASVGPFAHLRDHAHVGERAKVGNFVELKKTALGAGSKSGHLAYLGDATIGEKVNIGAGTITCNYDGERKNPTIIEDGAFIGSDSQLIAPVRIGTGAYVGSGTTVREDVPAGALAISAGKQRNVEGWVEERRKKKRT
jgi:bifunctional UDP-N-acetylglucosamine pyrophosphorylase / glucosamine-1-phosphate N-acetyltransferase